MTEIFCYSGTGNTMRAATLIAGELGGAEIRPFAVGAEPKEEASRVGFMFPVYYGVLPRLVTEFFAQYRPRDSLEHFAVATCGGAAMNALREANAALRVRGSELAYAASIRSVANNVLLYNVNPDKAHPRLRAADEAARKIGAEIAAGARRRTGALLPLVGRFLRYPERDADRAFVVNRQACARCGLCARLCPRGNIAYDERGHPLWKGNCDQCLACLHWCPAGAIDCGVRTVGRGRYHNPDVRAEDIPR